MSLIKFLQKSFEDLHQSYRDAIKDLSHEQAHWVAGGKGNHIAFVLWHYVRTEDNIIRFVLQRRPTVWMEGGWDTKFQLDSKAQGTGMPHQQAVSLELSPLEDFTRYMNLVFKETEEYVARVPEEELERQVLVKPLGELPLSRLLGNILVTHGFGHLGEIWTLKGIQGLQGSPI